jgi:hypothetical protein
MRKNVAHTGQMRNVYKMMVGKPEHRGVDGRIILNWNLGGIECEIVEWILSGSG